MAESEFEKIAKHKDKLIKDLTFKDGKVGIKWQKVVEDADGEKHIDGGSIESSEPARDKFNEAVDELRPVVRDYFVCKTPDEELLEMWNKNIFITKISFNYSTRGKTAKITANFFEGQLALPAIPLYDPEIPSHINGTETTFGEVYSKILINIMNEAKIYLSGDRGPMQAVLVE